MIYYTIKLDYSSETGLHNFYATSDLDYMLKLLGEIAFYFPEDKMCWKI